jgi:hypothetical protein
VADFDNSWLEIDTRLDCKGGACACIHLGRDAEAAAAKKRVLDELRKFGLHFNESPSLQVDPASAERTLLALRLQAATPGMTFAEASRQVREKK